MVVRTTSRLTYQTGKLVLFVGLLLAALYVSLGRIIAAALPAYKDEITDAVSEALGTEVACAGLHADWRYFDPVVSITDLTVGSTDAPAILMRDVTLRMSSLLSLRSLAPVVTEIGVTDIGLTLTSVDGRWHVRGLEAGDAPFDFSRLSDLLNHVEMLRVEGLALAIDGPRGAYLVSDSEGLPLRLVREGDERTILLPMHLTRTGEGPPRSSLVYLGGRYSGNPATGEDLSANLYLDAPDVLLSDFVDLPPVGGRSPGDIEVDTEAWLEGMIHACACPVHFRSVRSDFQHQCRC